MILYLQNLDLRNGLAMMQSEYLALHRMSRYVHNSYILQMEQYELEGRMLFCLGNVTNLLDVTPSP